MDNNLPTDDNQKPVTSVDTPPSVPETPSVIPETPEETPTEKPAEPTIEIGSLGQPSLSTIQDVGGKTSNKSKKIKSVVSVLGLLLIIASLPLTVLLVKQRQEIRKEAASTNRSGSISFCGITISPGAHNEQNGTYTFNYSITGNGHTVEVHEYGCVCSEGDRESCGPGSGTCTTDKYTRSTPIIDESITVRQPSGDCGTFQADVFVLSVDGKTECHNN